MDTTSLAARIERLERQNRVMKRGGAVAAVAVAVVLLTGQGAGGVAETIKARSYLVVDQKGTTRGMWGFAGESPTFQLFDAEGRPRVGLSVLEPPDKKDTKKVPVPSLAFTDREGRLRAELKVVEEFGAPTFQMFDDKGVTRLGLSVLDTGEPTVVLIDDRGCMRTLVKVMKDGAPVVTLNDARGKPRAGLRLADKGGAPSLIFNHEDDRAHLQMLLGGDGAPRIIMNDQHGTVLFKAP